MKDTNGNNWMLLLKLGKREYLEQLRLGKLYMNTLRYFVELEGDSARGDRSEGVDHIIQPKHVGDFYIDSGIPSLRRINIPSSELAGPVQISLNRTAACNLFCLFAVTSPIDGVIFPREHSWFGESFVLFTNTQAFVDRVWKAAVGQGLHIEAGRIRYYDAEDFSGKVGRFAKPSRYAYQQEYRIALETGRSEPFLLDVGDLTDITSEVLPVDKVDEILKFSSADAVEAGLNW